MGDGNDTTTTGEQTDDQNQTPDTLDGVEAAIGDRLDDLEARPGDLDAEDMTAVGDFGAEGGR